MNVFQTLVVERIAAAIARLTAQAKAADEFARAAHAAASAARLAYRAAPGADAEVTMMKAAMRSDMAHHNARDAQEAVQAAHAARAFVEAALVAEED